MNQFDELALRTALGRAAASVEARDLALRVDHRISVHERRVARTRRALVGALAAFVVACGAVAFAVRHEGSTPDIVPATPRTGIPGWAPIAPSPLGPRAAHRQVWTGTEVLVFGGYGMASELSKGMAAYDPMLGTWRTLAAPAEFRSEQVVWTGDRLLVLNFDGALHSYDPLEDEWHRLQSSPIVGENRAMGMVWTGDVVYVPYALREGRSPQAVYDPEQDSWRELPNAPEGVGGQLLWTGEEVFVVGHTGGDGRSFPRFEAWSVDPVSGEWTELPRPPLVDVERRYATVATWTGQELVVAGGTHQTDAGAAASEALLGGAELTPALQAVIQPRTARDVAAYDPGSGTWRSLPDAPLPVTGLELGMGGPGIWTGHEVLAWAGIDPEALTTSDGTILLLDPSTGEWRVVAPPPEGVRQWAPTTWTGHELIWWSGEPTVGDADPGGCCITISNAGSSFTP